MNKTEILAPAGNLENFKTAIHNGADAVYLGMQGFNARAKAENFTKENIKEVVRFAHLFGVKVYLTVNTLVNNDEIPELLQTVKCAVEAKVDAFLVQDFGVLSLLKHHFKNINLHASTQMGIHNLYGAKMAEKLGITRIVLSRETKLEDIIEIKNNTNLEIEYFVQGALCVAFSGNCYLSNYLTGDSGNRGKCKQMCRLLYKNSLTGEEKYFLSPSDLCLLKNLDTLIKAGVTSFKIEGRLRRAGYVGQAVQSYKKAIKMLEENSFDEKFLKEEKFKLKKVFSRGNFNENAYLEKDTPKDIINSSNQNHTGYKIGKVLEVKPFKQNLKQVVIESEKNLNSFDGLKFFENDKEVGSLGVGNVAKIGTNKYKLITSQFIKPNWTVNLICDFENEKKFEEERRKLDVKLTVEAKVDKPLKITASHYDVSVPLESDFVCPKGKTSITSKQEIETQVCKLGEIFTPESIEIFAQDVFIPKSKINELRRNVLALLEEEIIKKYEKHLDVTFNTPPLKLNQTKQDFKEIFVFDKLSDTRNLNKNALFVYAPKNYDADDILNISKNFENFGLYLPTVANGKDLKLLENTISKLKNITLVANNIYAFYFNAKIIAGTGMNAYNNYTQSFLADLGANACVLSFEQNIKNVDDENFFIYSGKPALMTFCHCPYKETFKNECTNCKFNDKLSYTNQSGKTFKIRRIKLANCYFELLADKKIENFGKLNFIDLRD